MDIRLCEMTNTLCRTYMQGFELDPALFADPANYKPYVYDEAACDAYFKHQQQPDRIYLAILGDEVPIGEIVLKKINRIEKHCTMGISLQCDRYKNRGYGTRAEILALMFEFEILGMDTVYADSLPGNKRSQHVLEKAGFVEIDRDDTFVYYQCNRTNWNRQIS